MTDRRYIVVKQIRASDLQDGEIARYRGGSWFRHDGPPTTNLELVEIQVEEPSVTGPERWIDSAREVDHHAFCGTCGHHVRDHAETGPRWDCRRLVAILPYEKHGETRPSISGICACRHFTPAGVLA